MAAASKGKSELPMGARKYMDRETSTERTKVRTEPKQKAERRVAVVYYLCRSGQLEHPHFMEVPLSSSEGLYLRDVLNRLNILRGNGMAGMYSWSSKRSYKNGFVWHDLSENDFIYPAHGQEYVLKGSEILRACSSSRSEETLNLTVFSSPEKLPHIPKSIDQHEFPFIRRRNQSWSHIDLTEYKVYKAESTPEAASNAADASTQTDDRSRWRRKPVAEDEAGQDKKSEQVQEGIISTNETELSREEISPPPSSSSPEALEYLTKGDVDVHVRTAKMPPSGRMKASTMLMQLISCGSISVKEHGFSLVSQYRGRLPRLCSAQGAEQTAKEMESMMENRSLDVHRVEDKEYFSGSLIETKNESGGTVKLQNLKRSSSYNAERSSKSDLMANETETPRAKCIPRKTSSRQQRNKATPSRAAAAGAKG